MSRHFNVLLPDGTVVRVYRGSGELTGKDLVALQALKDAMFKLKQEKTMTRELTGHKVNPANDVLTVSVLDEPGAGGANHLYHITGFDSGSNPSDPWMKRHGESAKHSTILFQNGPISDVGVNGVTHEVLLSILIDRLEAFQAGPFANDYNASALSHLQSAQGALLDRTRERMGRGVEGTHKV